MMPIHLINVLFGVTLAAATLTFVGLYPFTPIEWFMYAYLVIYRTKVYLDDIVYYKKMKKYAVGGGDPIIGFVTWLLWIATAYLLGNERAYFGLTSLTFGIGIIWVTIASKNVPNEAENSMREIVQEMSLAHTRWRWFNVIPFVTSGVYFYLYFIGIAVAWDSVIFFWVGPVILSGSLIWDIITDYRFMFQLDVPPE